MICCAMFCRARALALCCWFFTLALGGGLSAETRQRPLAFDMGTPGSPTMAGYVPVTPDNLYDARRGYGFLEQGHHGFLLQEPPEYSPWQMSVPEHFRRHASPLMIDGVRDTTDIGFRIDVAPGKYRVTVSMGDINQAMGCITLLANDQVVEENIRFHHGLYRHVANVHRPWSGSMGVIGFYDRIRFTVNAPNGSIVIKAIKDESIYHELLEIEKAKEMKVGKPITREKFEAMREKHTKDAPYVDIGEPFIDIPLLGIEVRPYLEPPVTMPEHGDLAYSGSSRLVAHAVEAFNVENYEKAEKLLDGGATSQDALGAGLAYMWLAGWPPHEQESRIVLKIRDCLHQALKESPGNVVALEAWETFTDFDKALTRNLQRGIETSHFIDNVQAAHLFQLAQPGDPLYWKARLQAARMMHQLDPINRGDAAGATGDALMKEVLALFPDNRYARYYIDGEYDDKQGPWAITDYSQAGKDAPEWAAKVHEVFNRMLDLSEWWIENKQRADGSIGGGWGDDVEFVGFFGYYGNVSEGASPKSLEGAAKLVNGVFELSGDVDPETNFIWSTADTEHATEWTGDTLPMMIAIDFGNPLWIERAMGSARLMKNLWTGINPKGHRHFRSDYIGGMGVSTDQEPTDGHFTWRGVNSIDRVYWYNQNPAIRKLLLEWSDAWLEDSMAETGGKPKGVVPQEIAYADCTPHSPAAKDWKNKFGHRYNYKMAMPLMGYRITLDRKYLEPFRYCAELYDTMPSVEIVKKPPAGTPESIKKAMSEAKAVWEMFSSQESDMHDSDAVNPYDSVVKKCVDSIDRFRSHWPKMTTEASATDRIGFHGMPLTLQLMTGGGVASTAALSASVTYQGVGRDFAAFVSENTFERLRISIYVFRDGEIEMGIRPWDLNFGWRYKVTVSPDDDLDGVPDGPAMVTQYDLIQRGKLCPLKIEGRRTSIVQLEPMQPLGQVGLLPDLAMSERDIEFNREKGFIMMRVHNIGSTAVRDVPVALYEGASEDGRLIGRSQIGELDWPQTLQPETLKFGWRYSAKGSEATFTAVVDPDNQLPEIVETNNRVTRTIRFHEEPNIEPQKRKKSRSRGGR